MGQRQQRHQRCDYGLFIADFLCGQISAVSGQLQGLFPQALEQAVDPWPKISRSPTGQTSQCRLQREDRLRMSDRQVSAHRMTSTRLEQPRREFQVLLTTGTAVLEYQKSTTHGVL